MENYRKLPPRVINLAENEQIHISEFSPVGSSFHLAIGVSFIESMNRLRDYPHLISKVLESFNQYKTLAQGYASLIGLENKFIHFVQIVEHMNSYSSVPNFRQLSEQWFQNNAYDILNSIEIGLHCLIHVTQGQTTDDFKKLENFARCMNLTVLLISPTGHIKLTRNLIQGCYPLLCIRYENDSYSIAYFPPHLHQDQYGNLTEENLSDFPFMNWVEMKFGMANTSLTPDERLIQALSNRFLNKGISDKDLLTLIEDAVKDREDEFLALMELKQRLQG